MTMDTETAPVLHTYFISYFFRIGSAWGFQRCSVDMTRMIESLDDIVGVEKLIHGNHLTGTEICITNFQFIGSKQNTN